MTIKSWDREYSQLAHDIKSVRRSHDVSSRPDLVQLLPLKIKCVQSQINIDRHLEMINKTVKKDLLLLPREYTMIHWGGQFLGKIRGYLQLMSRISTRSMWLKLISSRLGDLSETDTIDPEEYVEISVRKANLKKTEDLLTSSLIELSDRKKKINKKITTMDVVKANHEASGSMQARLGVDLDHGLRNPTMLALHSLFLPRKFQESSSSLPGLDNKSGDMIEMCRNLLNGFLEGRTPNRKSVRRFAHTMHQLEKLEQQTRSSVSEITTGPFAGLTFKGFDKRAGQTSSTRHSIN